MVEMHYSHWVFAAGSDKSINISTSKGWSIGTRNNDVRGPAAENKMASCCKIVSLLGLMPILYTDFECQGKFCFQFMRSIIDETACCNCFLFRGVVFVTE